MDSTVLEDIGLTNAETKVYIALLGLGVSTAGPIINKTGLQNSVVHLTLHKLLEKGFISYVKKGRVKHYRATDPKNIISYIEEMKKRYKKILPELLLKQKKEERQDAEIYEGFHGFKILNYEYIKDAKKGDESLFFSFNPPNPDEFENVFNFYKEFEKERKKLGIIVRGIVPSNLKQHYIGRNLKNILFVDFPILTNMNVLNNKVYFTPWEDNQISILIYSRQFANSVREYFYSIWNKYKK